MKDTAITTSPTLTAADAAVDYMLQRIQHDVDLRWLMIGTEAFHRLCAVEAARTSEDVELVKERRSQIAASCRDERPRIPEMTKRIEDLERMLAKEREDVIDLRDGMDEFDGTCAREDIEEALELCPACTGLAVDSLGRCPMCRKILKAIS